MAIKSLILFNNVYIYILYDVMNYIKPEVSTVCVGQAASAAAFILAAGAKNKRYALKNAEIMLHQVSAGGEGNIEDLKIMIKETERANERMMSEISKITGKSIEQVKKDLDRDCYMSSEEAKEYGLIDEILVSRE